MINKNLMTITIIFLIFISSNRTSGYALSATFKNTSNGIESFSRYDGNLLIVDATASWCTSCDAQLHNLQDVYNSVDNTVSIITLSIDQSDTVPKIIDLKNRFSSPWTFGLDYKSEFIDVHSVSVLPTLFLFNEQGFLIKKWLSITPAKEILDKLNENIETPFEANFDSGESRYQGTLFDELIGNFTFQLFGSLTIIIVLYLFLVPSNSIESKPLDTSKLPKKEIPSKNKNLSGNSIKSKNKKKIKKASNKKVRRNRNTRY